jgi:predicted nucleotidyltransferase component of viral defense system
MPDVIEQMLEKYQCITPDDHKNTLKEILQEIALLGLSRSGFFDYGAFYGGSALRIFYGLDRFSEDLDFSLIDADAQFDILPYCDAIKNELGAYGFHMEVTKKQKKASTQIESAFIKGETLIQLLTIKAVVSPVSGIHKNEVLKIKIEVDTSPPDGANYEVKYALRPIPYSIRIFSDASLFAGKMHAVLCRSWKGKRVKGRDLYDFVWYITNEIPLSLGHLGKRMEHTGHIETGDSLNRERLIELLKKKFREIDFKQAKNDVYPFIKDSGQLAMWSSDFFNAISTRIILA